MERLSTLDAEFLHMEDGISHMHIAGMSVFEGPAPRTDDLVALLATKLATVPRYRQRIRNVPFELGRPVWADDPHFNLEYHVRHTALPQPFDPADLDRLMGRLMSQELDRNRPLWETWLVEGLEDGQWAIISKVHHCMVDGIAGVDLLAMILDVDPDARPGDAEPWTPAPEPNVAQLVLDAWGGLAADGLALAARLPRAALDPVGTLRSTLGLSSGLIRMGRHLTPSPKLSIEGAIGPHRVWSHSSASIDDVRIVRKAYGTTLNDVVLAAVTQGYADLLAKRGDDLDDAVVRTLVPVSVRASDARGVFDNRVSAILYELPVAVTDPVDRLARVHRDMTDLKAAHMAEAGAVVTMVGNLAPPMLIGTTSRLVTRLLHQLPQRSVNTVTTNVPGPQLPLFCLGRPLLEHRPYVPIYHGIRVGTAILSYNGRLFFGITGDYDSVPDVGVIAAGVADGIAELTACARDLV